MYTGQDWNEGQLPSFPKKGVVPKVSVIRASIKSGTPQFPIHYHPCYLVAHILKGSLSIHTLDDEDQTANPDETEQNDNTG